MSLASRDHRVGRHIAVVSVQLFLAITLAAQPVRAATDHQLCDDAATQPTDAIRACTAMLDTSPDPADVPDIYLNRGNAHARIGDLTSAISDFDEGINRRPDFLTALKNRGVVRMRAGNPEGSLADFSQGLKLSKNAPEFLTLRGTLLNTMGEYERAIADFDKALAANPNLIAAHQNRAFAMTHTRQRDRALTDYADVIRLAPQNPQGFIGRATVYMDNAAFDLAIKDLDRAKALDPKNAYALSIRGEARRLKGDLTNALSDHAEAIRLSPEDETVYINRSLVYRDKREYDKALTDLGDAIVRNPKSDLAYTDRGEIFQLKGDYDRSLTDLEKAITLNPRSPVAQSLLGDTLRYKGELEKALEAYNEATHVVSDYVPAYTGRALVYEKKGDFAAAKAEFEKALRLPSDVDAEKAKPAQALARDGLDNIRQEEHRLADAEARQQALAAQLKKQEQQALASNDSARSIAEQAAMQAEGKARDAEAKARDAEAKLRQAEEQQAAAQTGAMKAEARAKALEASVKAQEAEADERVSKAEQRARQLEAQLAAASSSAALPDQGRRVALVIGNSAYETVPLLPNPRRDAAAVAQKLRDDGFNSVTLIQDSNLQQMKKALRAFQDQADSADWAIVYYAGHGIEISGQNFLLPTDAHLQSDRDADDESISLRYVLERIHNARKLRMVILDACRDNPFQGMMKREIASRAVSRGLVRYEPKVANEIIVYAAKDGEQAADGDADGHSPFARALISRLDQPRLEINKMFRLVTSDVLTATGNRQQPFVYGSTPSEEDLYFRTK